MNQLSIKILDQNFIIKKTFRGLILFEEMTGRAASDAEENISDVMKLFFCFMKGGNPVTFTFEYEEFLNIIDDHPEIFEEFNTYLQRIGKKQNSNYTPPKKPRK